MRVFDPRHVVALSLHEQRREVEQLLASAAPVTPVFQPVMEVATGRVAGYEALARFAPPNARPPHLWFAQAHRAGLGPALEAAAIRAALAVPGRPAGTFLAVNVSPAALLSPEVKRALPFDLDGITIELTEHDAFDEDGALELELAALRERGARIALDDAGAGYAGLQQLIRLRPDIVKVDRSLVAQIHAEPSKLALLQALAGFASTTGAAVCAEGVEELSELRALASIDVTYAQGYALARPAAPWPAIPAAVAAADGRRRRARHAPRRRRRGRRRGVARRAHRRARPRAHGRGAQGRARRRHPAARRRGGRDLAPRRRRRRPHHRQRPRVVGGGRALAARGLPDDPARDRRTRRSAR